MKILVDTNRVIAALLKDSTTRDILCDDHFEFLTPEYTLTEIQEHKKELLKKTKLNEAAFEVVLAFLFENITIIPQSEYQDLIAVCKNDISDPDDIPHLAACIASNAEGIWAHDPHFQEQKKVKVFSNHDLLTFSGKNKR